MNKKLIISIVCFIAALVCLVLASTAHAKTLSFPVPDAEKVVMSSDHSEIYFGARGFGTGVWYKAHHQKATLDENGDEFTQDYYCLPAENSSIVNCRNNKKIVINYLENGEIEFLYNDHDVISFDSIFKKVNGKLVYLRDGDAK